MMSTETNTSSRFERVLAYLIVIIVAVSVIAFFTVLIAAAMGVSTQTMSGGLWPLVTTVSYVGLPIGFVLIMTLLFSSMRRRKKANAPGARR